MIKLLEICVKSLIKVLPYCSTNIKLSTLRYIKIYIISVKLVKVLWIRNQYDTDRVCARLVIENAKREKMSGWHHQ